MVFDVIGFPLNVRCPRRRTCQSAVGTTFTGAIYKYRGGQLFTYRSGIECLIENPESLDMISEYRFIITGVSTDRKSYVVKAGE